MKIRGLRFVLGITLLALAIWGGVWWGNILDMSGGPDVGNEFIFAIPTFISLLVGAIGAVLAIQGVIREKKK